MEQKVIELSFSETEPLSCILQM